MSAIDRVKKLLAAAEGPGDIGDDAFMHLMKYTLPIAQALVKSQEALASRVALREHETSCNACWNGLECRSQAQLSDDNEKKETTALRMDGLEEMMKG